jgi:hypothetical protein
MLMIAIPSHIGIFGQGKRFRNVHAILAGMQFLLAITSEILLYGVFLDRIKHAL